MSAKSLQIEVAAHIHTRSDLPEHDCQGEQTLAEAIQSAADGYAGALFTPHTTNPGAGQPHAFGASDPLVEALLSHNQRVRQQKRPPGRAISLFCGVEANLLPEGLDAPHEVLEDCDFVIASIHGVVPQNPFEVLERFHLASHYDQVDALGHPLRYVEGVDHISWRSIFRTARDTNTAVEANFNAWHSYGPGKARRKGDRNGVFRSIGYHYEWLRELADAGAPVLVSLDVHNAGMWPRPVQAEAWQPTLAQYQEYLDLLIFCGIPPERIINRTVETFTAWVQTPKLDRWRLLG